ncbi:MAG: hypothetical protein GOMPHAMPRED_007890 [Gomphillus americanus]|uniref:MSP domain-containing protein n=1 Tax=Gomphillus americanus TaxID=1940652 RepID=A0A8H3EVI7_9LECA|nr:MAG: hypothetical protein GOMPHAMPRED_007890 [Gomphillus americanus]
MSVELDPPELGFRRPFLHEVTQILKLTNPNNDPVAFKVKTTAPKQYCVRPNSGHIEPGKSVEVQVLLQAMKEDPPLDARCRDKFLVQSVAIDADQINGETNIWANLDKVAKDSIKEKKIRVSFLPERDTAAATNGTVDNHPRPLSSHPNMPQSHEAPPAYAPPSPPSVATSPTSAAVAPQSARDFSTPSKGTSDSPYTAAAIAAVAGGATSTLAGSHSSAGETTTSAPLTEKVADLYQSAAQSVSNAASATGETLQQQLDNAKETIISLKEQIQSQNLRQRQSAAATTSGSDIKERSTPNSTGLAQQQHASEGVPVQMVAALCLLSFLVAYFFF